MSRRTIRPNLAIPSLIAILSCPLPLRADVGIVVYESKGVDDQDGKRE